MLSSKKFGCVTLSRVAIGNIQIISSSQKKGFIVSMTTSSEEKIGLILSNIAEFLSILKHSVILH